MPGPIQITLILTLMTFILIYVMFFRSLIISSQTTLSKIIWMSVGLLIPFFGVLIYFALKDRLSFKLN